MSVLCELTMSELGMVAGGDAGGSFSVDDGSIAGSFTAVNQPTSSSASINVTGSADKNGEFEASFSVFSNTGLPED